MSVESKIREIIAEQLGINEDDIALEASLTDDLGADSLDVVELVMALEEEFEIEISDAEADGLNTVNDFIGFVSQRTS